MRSGASSRFWGGSSVRGSVHAVLVCLGSVVLGWMAPPEATAQERVTTASELIRAERVRIRIPPSITLAGTVSDVRSDSVIVLDARGRQAIPVERIESIQIARRAEAGFATGFLVGGLTGAGLGGAYCSRVRCGMGPPLYLGVPFLLGGVLGGIVNSQSLRTEWEAVELSAERGAGIGRRTSGVTVGVKLGRWP